MINYLKKVALWFLTFIACYCVINIFVPVRNLQFSLHGWAWVFFILVELTVATGLSILDLHKRPVKIHPAAHWVIGEMLDWMGLAVSLVVTIAVMPHQATCNSTFLAFAWTAAMGFSSGVTDVIVRRKGLEKKPDGK
jgi:hypothetical protein